MNSSQHFLKVRSFLLTLSRYIGQNPSINANPTCSRKSIPSPSVLSHRGVPTLLSSANPMAFSPSLPTADSLLLGKELPEANVPFSVFQYAGWHRLAPSF